MTFFDNVLVSVIIGFLILLIWSRIEGKTIKDVILDIVSLIKDRGES